MSLFSITPPPEIPVAERVAHDLLLQTEASRRERIAAHMAQFTAFWHGPESPAAILAAMGTNARAWLAAAAESAGHIARLAAIEGKQLDDVLPAEFYVPLREFVIHEDGSVTLAAE